jgi:hypothetical protein
MWVCIEYDESVFDLDIFLRKMADIKNDPNVIEVFVPVYYVYIDNRIEYEYLLNGYIFLNLKDKDNPPNLNKINFKLNYLKDENGLSCITEDEINRIKEAMNLELNKIQTFENNQAITVKRGLYSGINGNYIQSRGLFIDVVLHMESIEKKVTIPIWFVDKI